MTTSRNIERLHFVFAKPRSWHKTTCIAVFAVSLVGLQETCTNLRKFRVRDFLQRVSIACYAERCISHSKSVRPSDRLSVTRWHWVKTTQATVMESSLEDSPMTLVSSWLTSPQNSKGNMGSEGAESERGRKNRQFLANNSPYSETVQDRTIVTMTD